MTRASLSHVDKLMLADGGQLSGHSRRLAGLDELRCAEIDVADVSERTDGRDQNRAQKTDHDNLQMGPAVRTVNRMIHHALPSVLASNQRAWRRLGCDPKHKYALLFYAIEYTKIFKGRRSHCRCKKSSKAARR